MARFFDAIKALFPQGRAFQFFVENNKYKLIEALSALPENIRREAELVYFDLFPDTTRCPEKWEQVFALFFTKQEKKKRRFIIDALWKSIGGGQSAQFLQELLQCVDENIHIVENTPIINPFQVYASLDLAVCDNEIMICDLEEAVCDYRLGDQGFEPIVLQNDTSDLYSIPNDPAHWAACFFVCKQSWRDGSNNIIYVELLEMDIIWKNFIEYLILRIKPVHTTAVVFIDWKEETSD
jgi:hypothetical protein